MPISIEGCNVNVDDELEVRNTTDTDIYDEDEVNMLNNTENDDRDDDDDEHD